MSVSAQAAIRAWLNSTPIVGEGNPLSRGAYLREQRSPADGPYAVVMRTSEGVTSVVAEDSAVNVARMQCLVYAGTEESAETAASAVRGQIETLTGMPVPCPGTGLKILVADNYIGPFQIPVPPDAGEIFAFQVNADFVLTTS